MAPKLVSAVISPELQLLPGDGLTLRARAGRQQGGPQHTCSGSGRGYLITKGDGDTQEGKGHGADIPAD